MPSITRRSFAGLAASIGATLAWGQNGKKSQSHWRERRDLFPEGVASGDPDSTSVLLWTRCPAASRLSAEIAEDQFFERVVATASAPVAAAADWTCHVLVGGLKPARVYWYRFTDPNGLGSRIGRTITAPAVDDSRPAHFAFVSCQNANHGAQSAYRRMIFEDERASRESQLGFANLWKNGETPRLEMAILEGDPNSQCDSGNAPTRKMGTGSNFAAFAKLRACPLFARPESHQ